VKLWPLAYESDGYEIPLPTKGPAQQVAECAQNAEVVVPGTSRQTAENNSQTLRGLCTNPFGMGLNRLKPVLGHTVALVAGDGGPCPFDADRLARYRDQGIARSVVPLPSAKRDQILQVLDRWAELICRIRCLLNSARAMSARRQPPR
jgi:hypothetical protein